MDKKLNADLNLSQSVVNYVQAVYVGKMNYINILARFGQLPGSSDDFVRTEKIIERALQWKKDILNSIPLLSASWKLPETFDAQRSLSSLADIKPDLTQAAMDVDRLVKELEDFVDAEKLKRLIAHFGWISYSRETYLKGWVEFSQRWSTPEVTAQYSALLPGAQADVEATAAFVNAALKSEDGVDAALVEEVKNRSMMLGSIFRMYIHDITQLLHTYTPQFTFDLAGISHGDAARWKQNGFSPAQAGYWAAFRINPEDALAWMHSGVSDPASAASWAEAQISSAEAYQWTAAGVHSAADAVAWMQANVQADMVKDYIERGIRSPEQLRRPEN